MDVCCRSAGATRFQTAILAVLTAAFEKRCVLILCGSVNLRLVEAINELPAEVARHRLRSL